jgi:UDP:flavonoid glycosyltransferase YjiC (YdhE family)
MRVLLTTTGYAGHFKPLVPFGRACVRAGHEVRVAAPRSRGAIVERMGLRLQPCADPAEEDLARLVASLAEMSQRDGHAHMMAVGFPRVAARAVMADMVEIAEAWRPDIVVRESQEYAGALAAEHARIPHVRVALGLAAQEDETLSTAAASVDELRAGLGLPGDPDASALRGSAYLTPVPLVLEEPGADGCAATHRFRGRRNGPRSAAAMPDWWEGREGPVVYLTFGSVAALLGLFPRVYRAAIEALAGVPARILVTIERTPTRPSSDHFRRTFTWSAGFPRRRSSLTRRPSSAMAVTHPSSARSPRAFQSSPCRSSPTTSGATRVAWQRWAPASPSTAIADPTGECSTAPARRSSPCLPMRWRR